MRDARGVGAGGLDLGGRPRPATTCDARVLWEGEVELTADPQSVRYGDGKPARTVVQAVVAGPAFRGRPVVDVLCSEGLRPIYARLTPEQARAVAELLDRRRRIARRARARSPPPGREHSSRPAE